LWRLTKDKVESLIKRKHRRWMHWTIGKVLKDSQEYVSGLNRIDIPAAPSIEPYPMGPDPKIWKGPWRSITDQSIIVKHICMANIRQYNQAYPTPFGSGVLAEAIGSMANSPLAKSILEGNLPSLPNFPLQETQKILENLVKPLLLVSKNIKSEITSKWSACSNDVSSIYDRILTNLLV